MTYLPTPMPGETANQYRRRLIAFENEAAMLRTQQENDAFAFKMDMMAIKFRLTALNILVNLNNR